MLIIYKYLYVRCVHGVQWFFVCPSCGKQNAMPAYGPEPGKTQKCGHCHTLGMEGDRDQAQVNWSP